LLCYDQQHFLRYSVSERVAEERGLGRGGVVFVCIEEAENDESDLGVKVEG